MTLTYLLLALLIHFADNTLGLTKLNADLLLAMEYFWYIYLLYKILIDTLLHIPSSYILYRSKSNSLLTGAPGSPVGPG